MVKAIMAFRILCLLFLFVRMSGCKKEPSSSVKKFDQYAGTWTCAHFSSGSSARNNSSIYSSYDFGNDGKLYLSGSIPDTGSTGTLKQIKDTFDFQYNITTHIVNESQLTIDESYKGLKNGIARVSFTYNRTIQLVEGTTNYGNYDDSYSITPETIKINKFNHDSYTSYGWSRIMTKVK